MARLTDLLRRNRAAAAGGLIVSLAVVVSLAGPLLAPHDPNEPFTARTLTSVGLPIAPDAEFPLGADGVGRCELSRLLYGGRVSLAVAVAATLLVTLLGTLVGVTAGYAGGLVDTALMRLVDTLLSFPFLLVVMALNQAVASPGIWVLFVILGLFGWVGMSRQVRAKTMQIRQREFVTAAHALGASTPRIIVRHVLPNVAPLVLVIATTVVSQMIIVESSLSFLGVGLTPPSSSWGSMLRDAAPLIRTAPRLSLIPGVAILLTVVGFNLLGDGLRDALDPKS